jgi:hypothetical protein
MSGKIAGRPAPDYQLTCGSCRSMAERRLNAPSRNTRISLFSCHGRHKQKRNEDKEKMSKRYGKIIAISPLFLNKPASLQSFSLCFYFFFCPLSDRCGSHVEGRQIVCVGLAPLLGKGEDNTRYELFLLEHLNKRNVPEEQKRSKRRDEERRG